MIMSPQSKYWGDVSPLSHRDRRPWFSTSPVERLLHRCPVAWFTGSLTQLHLPENEEIIDWISRWYTKSKVSNAKGLLNNKFYTICTDEKLQFYFDYTMSCVNKEVRNREENTSLKSTLFTCSYGVLRLIYLTEKR